VDEGCVLRKGHKKTKGRPKGRGKKKSAPLTREIKGEKNIADRRLLRQLLRKRIASYVKKEGKKNTRGKRTRPLEKGRSPPQ